MVSCTQCRSPLSESARFCASCGAPASPSSERTQVVAVTATTTVTQVRDPVTRPVTRVLDVPPARELLVLAIDRSPSMDEVCAPGRTRLQAAQHGARNLVRRRAHEAPADEIALVAFHGAAEVVAPLTPTATGKAALVAAIDSLTHKDDTSLSAAVEAVLRVMDWQRPSVQRRLILLTDGHGGDARRPAKEFQARGGVIETIGVGRAPSDVDEAMLKAIASTVDGQLRYTFFRDYQAIVTHLTQVAANVGGAA